MHVTLEKKTCAWCPSICLISLETVQSQSKPACALSCKELASYSQRQPLCSKMKSLLNTVAVIRSYWSVCTKRCLCLCLRSVAFVLNKRLLLHFVVFPVRAYPVFFCRFPKIYMWPVMRNRKLTWYCLTCTWSSVCKRSCSMKTYCMY